MATGNSSELEVGNVNNSLIVEETGNADFEGSFEDIDLDNLNENQSRIDNVLRFLLNYNVPKKSVGRPKKEDSTKAASINSSLRLSKDDSDSQCSIPEDLRDSMKNISKIQDLHPGLLVDYLVRLNEFNKKILQSIGVLHKKYNEMKLKQPIVTSAGNARDVSNYPDTVNSATANVTEAEISKSNKEVDLECRVDAIEQKSNANIILCSGSVIKEAIEATGSNPEIDLKEKIVSTINDKLPGVLTDVSDFVRVSPYGKTKTHVKVICSSVQVRKKIIASARREKPGSIYFSEFLTNFRNGLFYSLRSLRNRFRDRIAAVYVRDGNLFYKLNGIEGFKTVRTQLDITKLEKKLTESEG